MGWFTEAIPWRRDPDHAARYDASILAQIDGMPEDDRLHGRAMDDSLAGLAGNDVLNGRYGDDTLDGGRGDDVLKGSGGTDKLFGGAGDDSLFGGTERQEGAAGASDQLDGGAGDDRLYGGAGREILMGGTGADRFIYSELSDTAYPLPDTVVDFEQGLDKVVFRGAVREAGDLHFIGHAEFSYTPGEVRFEVSSTSTGVLIDMDGDAAPDVRIIFQTTDIQFQASDFSF